MKATTQKAARELLAELVKLARPEPEPANSPWKTTKGWASAWGMSRSYTDKLLRNGIASGLWICEKRRMRQPNGNVVLTNHYRRK